MTLAISKAVEAGSKAVVCASTGNTSASAAAYAAKAALACAVLLPAGKVAQGATVRREASVVTVHASVASGFNALLSAYFAMDDE